MAERSARAVLRGCRAQVFVSFVCCVFFDVSAFGQTQTDATWIASTICGEGDEVLAVYSFKPAKMSRRPAGKALFLSLKTPDAVKTLLLPDLNPPYREEPLARLFGNRVIVFQCFGAVLVDTIHKKIIREIREEPVASQDSIDWTPFNVSPGRRAVAVRSPAGAIAVNGDDGRVLSRVRSSEALGRPYAGGSSGFCLSAHCLDDGTIAAAFTIDEFVSEIVISHPDEGPTRQWKKRVDRHVRNVRLIGTPLRLVYTASTADVKTDIVILNVSSQKILAKHRIATQNIAQLEVSPNGMFYLYWSELGTKMTIMNLATDSFVRRLFVPLYKYNTNRLARAVFFDGGRKAAIRRSSWPTAYDLATGCETAALFESDGVAVFEVATPPVLLPTFLDLTESGSRWAVTTSTEIQIWDGRAKRIIKRWNAEEMVRKSVGGPK